MFQVDELFGCELPEPEPGKWMTVTPKMAERYISENIANNRNLSIATVKRYAHDMKSKNFHRLPAVVVSSHGKLMDGQHTMHAIVRSGRTQRLIVQDGVDPRWMPFLDKGKKRTAGNTAQTHGIKRANSKASAVTPIIQWDKGGRGPGIFNNAGVTDADVEMFMLCNDDHLEEIVGHGTRAYGQVRGATPVVYFLAFELFSRLGHDEAVEFFDKLATGEMMRANHPIMTLRGRLQRIAVSRQSEPRIACLSMFIRAWNAWRDGRTMTKIPALMPGESLPEPR